MGRGKGVSPCRTGYQGRSTARSSTSSAKSSTACAERDRAVLLAVYQLIGEGMDAGPAMDRVLSMMMAGGQMPEADLAAQLAEHDRRRERR